MVARGERELTTTCGRLESELGIPTTNDEKRTRVPGHTQNAPQRGFSVLTVALPLGLPITFAEHGGVSCSDCCMYFSVRTCDLITAQNATTSMKTATTSWQRTAATTLACCAAESKKNATTPFIAGTWESKSRSTCRCCQCRSITTAKCTTESWTIASSLSPVIERICVFPSIVIECTLARLPRPSSDISFGLSWIISSPDIVTTKSKPVRFVTLV